jgi:hypothetical protein
VVILDMGVSRNIFQAGLKFPSSWSRPSN